MPTVIIEFPYTTEGMRQAQEVADMYGGKVSTDAKEIGPLKGEPAQMGHTGRAGGPGGMSGPGGGASGASGMGGMSGLMQSLGAGPQSPSPESPSGASPSPDMNGGSGLSPRPRRLSQQMPVGLGGGGSPY